MRAADVWIKTLADEYVTLRTQLAIPLVNAVDEGALDIVDVSEIQKHLRSRTQIPTRTRDKAGQLRATDTIRSDFGELLSYMILEQNYKTVIPWKPIAERESGVLTARGLDVLGFEETDPNVLTLVIGETKVSDQKKPTPAVVDAKKDSLSKSLQKHMKEHDGTSAKLWDIFRKIRDQKMRNTIMKAFLLWDKKNWQELKVVCCAMLVRHIDLYADSNFGLLHGSCDKLRPGNLRFLILAIPEPVDVLVEKFRIACNELIA